MIDVQKLREIGEAATPGPWRACLGSGHNMLTALRQEGGPLLMDFCPDYFLGKGAGTVNPIQETHNKVFVETAREVFSGLLDELEQLREFKARARRHFRVCLPFSRTTTGWTSSLEEAKIMAENIGGYVYDHDQNAERMANGKLPLEETGA